jgi:hypothetical protein
MRFRDLVEWMRASPWRVALSVGMLLLVAAPVVWLGLRPRATGSQGTRGSAGEQQVTAKLIGVIGGRFNGKPFMSRRAAMKEKMRPGEVLVVRFRVLSTAAVHLQISGPKASLGVWADGRPDSELPPAMLPAGEHALVADKQVLAIRAQEYGDPVRVTLIASPRQFPEGQGPSLGKLGADLASLAVKCPGCAVDVLEVSPPPEGVEPAEEFR